MSPEELNNKYFSKETRGYNIISRYYYKYHDLFKKTIFPDFNDFINQIFLNISGIDFSKGIKNFEAYIIGSIKIQCRVQLDKTLKMKNTVAESTLLSGDKENEPITFKIPSKTNNPEDILDIQEMLYHISLFKLQLKQREIHLLNFLIDEKPRNGIADEMQINLNTLDTHIRRLRVKMADYFKKLGYSSDALDKFEKQ
jgi:DNA-directed RNA polymerase specialized sigma24 family protein